MGWGPSRMCQSCIILMHAVDWKKPTIHIGVRDVRLLIILNLPRLMKEYFYLTDFIFKLTGVPLLSPKGFRCDRRSCKSRNPVGTNDEVSVIVFLPFTPTYAT